MPYVYNRVDEEIRRHVEGQFAEAYPSFDVQVHSAELVQHRGIRIRGLSIAEPNRREGTRPLVQIDEMMISCDATLPNLLRQEVEASRITVRRPVLRARKSADGTWDIARLWPLPKFGNARPEMVVENGVVEIIDSVGKTQRAITLRNLNVRAKHAASEAPSAAASIEDRTASSNVVLTSSKEPDSLIQSTLPPAPPKRISIEGSAAADHCKKIRFLGSFDPSAGNWEIGGTVEHLRIAPEFLSNLPIGSPGGGKTESLLSAAVFHGRCELDFHLKNDPEGYRFCLFQAAGRISEGRLHHPRLPRALNDVEATFVLGNAGFSINNLTARTGQTTIRLDCSGTGFNEKSSLSLGGEVRDLELDSELFDCLPDHMKEHWLKFLPRGNVHCNFNSLISGGRFTNLEGTIRLLDTSFTYYKTPYRVEHGRGTVTFNNGKFGNRHHGHGRNGTRSHLRRNTS